MNTILAAVRTKDTATILRTVNLIGGGVVDCDMRMARAALIEVYAEREGADAADALMTVLGM